MPGAESRIVTMKFDNTAFESGANKTLGTLGKLKENLNFAGVAKGLGDLQKNFGGFNLRPMEAGIEGVSKGFLAMSTVAVTALATITNKAVNAGLNLAKSLTISPIMDGFKEYNTTLNSTQTILANTGLSGSKGLAKVNASLQELNTYSDKTIYNFSEMAKNIGTFTAAGVKLKPATAAIKGIANLAAASGSSADQASTAMYQLSQAMSAGTVKLQDWNSVTNAGMGGKMFRTSLMQTARVHGIAVDAMVKKSGSFRESLKSGWLSSKILTDTLAKFTGDETVAQLKQQGYTDKQIKSIQKLAKVAQDAATKVKTLPQLINTLQEAVGSGWANTASIVFGNINEAKTMFSSVNDVLGKMISNQAKARNKMLADWKSAGGRTFLIQGITNAFHALMAIIKPIKDAFHEIFPPTTGKQLASMTKAFQDFTAHLIIGKQTSEGLKSTFKGLFAIFDIGLQIIKGLIGFVAGFFSVMSGGSGSVFSLTGNIGDLLAKFDEWLKKGDKIGSFFDKLSAARAVVMVPLVALVSALVNAFAGLTSGAGGVGKFIDGLGLSFGAVGPVIDAIISKIQGILGNFGSFGKSLGSLFDGFNIGSGKAKDSEQSFFQDINKNANNTLSIGDKIKAAWQSVIDAFNSVGTFLAPVWDVIKSIFSGMGDKLKTFVSGMGIEDALALVNTGFFIAFYLMASRFFKSMGSLANSAKKTFDNIGGVFKQLTSNLKTMQTNVRANIIMKIAASLAILAAAIWVLSRIDPVKLGFALGSLTIMLAELVGSLVAIQKTLGKGSSAKLFFIAAAMVSMSSAVLILSGAVAILGHMDPKTLVLGIGSVAAILGVVVGAAAIMSKGGGAAQILAASIAIGILAFSLTAMAGVIELFSKIDIETLLNGVDKIAAVMLILTLALLPLSLLGTNAVLGAAALAIMSVALVILATALKMISKISGGDLVKVVITLAYVLDMLAAAAILMTGTAAGAAAMLIMALALIGLGVALALIGNLDWSTILKALAAIVVALVALGIAAMVLAASGATLALMALGIALGLLGVGALMVGAGLLLFSMALAALAVTGAAGAAVLVGAIISIVELFPLIMQQVGLGILAFIKVLSTMGPPLVKALVVVIGAIITGLIQLLPKIGSLIKNLVTTILNVLVNAVPKIVVAAAKLIIGVLKGLGQNVGGIIKAAGVLIVNFITGIANALPKIVAAAVNLIAKFIAAIGKGGAKLFDAGVKTLIKFINGIADSIRSNTAAMNAAGANLASAIISGMTSGLTAGIKKVVDAAKAVAKGALDAAKHLLGSHSPSKEFEKLGISVTQGFAKGLVGSLDNVQTALNNMRDLIKSTIDSTHSDVQSAQDKLKKLQSAKKPNKPEIKKAQKDLSRAKNENTMATNASVTLSKTLKVERAEILRLGKAYDVATQAVNDATDALTEAKKVRTDAIASITSQYSTLPDIGADTTLSSYSTAIDQQTSDTSKLIDTLDLLKTRGLSDLSYQKLLGEGASVQPFLDSLLQGGEEGITKLNTLSTTFAQSALSTYEQNLSDETAATLKFKASLDSARALGMDDPTYQKLLDQGVTAQPFLDELISSGATGISNLNTLNANLATAAASLGDTAGHALHDAAVTAAQTTLDDANKALGVIVTQMTDVANVMTLALATQFHRVGASAAQGIVNGLKDSLSPIKKQMTTIAKAMVKAIKAELKAKSPSKVMAEVGKFTNQGLAEGLDKYSHLVERSASGVANNAIDTIKSTMDQLAAATTNVADMNPVIAPVLDLTQLQSDADKMNALLLANTLAANVSYDQASAIAASQQDNQNGSQDATTPPAPTTTVTFEQNNFSPKALSPVEIYRQTKNQLSLAKEALGV
jgi:tape measure domain-containing protein